MNDVTSKPLLRRSFGSLVTNENQPSTVPWVSGSGSNCTGTLVIFEASIPAALTKAAHTDSLVAWTLIFFLYISCGVLIALLVMDMMQNGFFWYWAPMIFSGAPLTIAAPVMSGALIPTRAFFVTTSVSWGVAEGPPAIRVAEEKPSAL